MVALATSEESAINLRALAATNVRIYPAIGLTKEDLDCVTTVEPSDRPTLRFISAGRLLHWKGFHLGLRAFARANLPGAEYWIVGSGAERRRLEALATQLGISENVVFWGALSREETLQRIRECDVLMHPSLHDSGALICLEAMAASRPIICLGLGGPKIQVTDNVGVKVLARDPEQTVTELAAAMKRLAYDSKLRCRMGIAGRERIVTQYLWDHKVKYYEATYTEAITLFETCGKGSI